MIRSVASGSPWARATASAAMVLSSPLLGETRPTANQRAPRRGVPAAGGAPASWEVVPALLSAADGETTAVAAKPDAARCASL